MSSCILCRAALLDIRCSSSHCSASLSTAIRSSSLGVFAQRHVCRWGGKGLGLESLGVYMGWFLNDAVSFSPGYSLHPYRFYGRAPLRGLFSCRIKILSNAFPELPNFKPMNGHTFALRRLLRRFAFGNVYALFVKLVLWGFILLAEYHWSISVEFSKRKLVRIRYVFQKWRA